MGDTSHLRVKYTEDSLYMTARGHDTSHLRVKYTEDSLYMTARGRHKPSEGEIYRGLPVYDGKRTPKPTKPREPKSREAMKFLRLLGKTCEGKLPKFGLPKLPKDCRGN